MNFDLSLAWRTVQGIINGFLASLPNIIIAVVVFGLVILLARGLGVVLGRMARRRSSGNSNLGIVLQRLTNAGMFLFGLLIAVTIIFPSIKPADFIQLLGISSVAIGFAFRDILQNFLAGILILLGRPFIVGDQIVFEGFEGTVDEIQARATTITTYDNQQIVIPNGSLYTSAVTVKTAFEKRRLEYEVGIGYGDDAEHAKRVILEAIKPIPDVLDDPAPDVLLMEFGDSGMVLRVRWWIAPPRRSDALSTHDQVLIAVRKAFAEEGIDIPYATRQILFHDQTEEADGDRSRQREGWPAGRRSRIEDRGSKIEDRG